MNIRSRTPYCEQFISNLESVTHVYSVLREVVQSQIHTIDNLDRIETVDLKQGVERLQRQTEKLDAGQS